MFQPTALQLLELQASATILAALVGGYLLGVQWLYRSSEATVFRLILSFTIVAVSLVAAIPTGLEFLRWFFVFFVVLANGLLIAVAQRQVFKNTTIGGRELTGELVGVSTAVQFLFYAALLSAAVDMHWWKVVIAFILGAVALKGSEISFKRFIHLPNKNLWFVWHGGMLFVVATAIFVVVFFT